MSNTETKVERDWTTRAGFRAVVLMTRMGHRCGYVGVPKGHPLHGVDYSEPCVALALPADDEPIGKRGIISVLCASVSGPEARPDYVFDVHGGITYAGGDAEYPAENPEDLWWFGYDCGHAGDAKDPEWIAQQESRLRGLFGGCSDDVFRSLEYCEQECESLAEQFVSRLARQEAT